MAQKVDLSQIDRAPDAIMNTMLWKAVKGENAKLPVPVRAAFVTALKGPGGDDGD